MCGTRTVEYYLAIKEWNYVICSNMDATRDFHTKWNKSEKDKYHMISYHFYVEYMAQVNLSTKQK